MSCNGSIIVAVLWPVLFANSPYINTAIGTSWQAGGMSTFHHHCFSPTIHPNKYLLSTGLDMSGHPNLEITLGGYSQRLIDSATSGVGGVGGVGGFSPVLLRVRLQIVHAATRRCRHWPCWKMTRNADIALPVSPRAGRGAGRTRALVSLPGIITCVYNSCMCTGIALVGDCSFTSLQHLRSCRDH